jgi:hypothetical protein
VRNEGVKAPWFHQAVLGAFLGCGGVLGGRLKRLKGSVGTGLLHAWKTKQANKQQQKQQQQQQQFAILTRYGKAPRSLKSQ